MVTRFMLFLIAVAAGIATYYIGDLQGINERWPQLAAAIAVGTTLVLFLHLFTGGNWKPQSD
jgi:hypothetical protein